MGGERDRHAAGAAADVEHTVLGPEPPEPDEQLEELRAEPMEVAVVAGEEPARGCERVAPPQQPVRAVEDAVAPAPGPEAERLGGAGGYDSLR
jgi:hypothetical protein